MPYMSLFVDAMSVWILMEHLLHVYKTRNILRHQTDSIGEL